MNLEFRKTWSTVIHPILGRRQIQREATGRYRISRFLSGTGRFLAERRRDVETDRGIVQAWDLIGAKRTRAAAIAECQRDSRERDKKPAVDTADDLNRRKRRKRSLNSASVASLTSC